MTHRIPSILTRLLVLLVAASILAACPGQRHRTVNPERSRQGQPHVAWPTGMAPTVRVRLSTPTRSGRAHISVRGDWTLLDLSGTPLASGTALEALLLASEGDWSLGTLPVPSQGAELVPAEDGDLRVDKRRYPGSLRVARSVDRRYRVFVETSMPSYLEGVIGGEIPAVFPRESQRTQAIVARTYALSRAPAALHGDPILLSDSGLDDQEYTGIPSYGKHRKIANDAVQSTRGEVVLHDDQPLLTWYHSTCGGHTCPSGPVFNVPTLRPLAGVPCTDCRASKYFDWTAQIPAADFAKAVGRSGAVQGVRVSRTTSGGRATHVAVKVGGRETERAAGELRLAVGPSKLRSVLITRLRLVGDQVYVTGNGWGHGVGLCQMGAKGMAEQGSDAIQIITRYYPGAEVAKLW